jgi:MerR family mercuric resistance operon transcriptional regulator
MIGATLTIGRLARAAAVNVEAVRYYQTRKLLPTPSRAVRTIRYYPATLVERIHFIKRAQDLGFSLEEIGELLHLHDGTDRVSIRKVASNRLAQIEAKLKDLSRMRAALSGLIDACHHAASSDSCPIIEASRRANGSTYSAQPRAGDHDE